MSWDESGLLPNGVRVNALYKDDDVQSKTEGNRPTVSFAPGHSSLRGSAASLSKDSVLSSSRSGSRDNLLS